MVPGSIPGDRISLTFLRLWQLPHISALVLLLPVVQECNAACNETMCMQRETPYLAQANLGILCRSRKMHPLAWLSCMAKPFLLPAFTLHRVGVSRWQALPENDEPIATKTASRWDLCAFLLFLPFDTSDVFAASIFSFLSWSHFFCLEQTQNGALCSKLNFNFMCSFNCLNKPA